MNAVIAAVGIMLILSLSRVHVVIALIVGALAGGLVGAGHRRYAQGLQRRPRRRGHGSPVLHCWAPLPWLSPSPAWPMPWPTAPWP